jgi:signal transduction histidine kinase
VPVGLPSQLQSQLGKLSERMVSAVRLVGLVALLWVTAHEQPATGVRTDHAASTILMVGVAAGWVGWMVARRVIGSSRLTFLCLALLSVSGGVLAVFAPASISFIAIGGLGAGIAFEGPVAIGIGAIGVAALGVAVAVAGAPLTMIADGAVSVAGGLMIGSSRRQYVVRATHAEELLAERVRADVERDRAAALAERNRIGREVHDVLAHSLGALSVQLTAADALLESDDDTDRARQLVQQARHLAVQGLEETRQAVHALRDEPVELTEQLTAMATRDGAALTVTGEPHPLAPDAGLALYRAAQEAVTNARKHAPGAPVTMRLDFDRSATTLVVANGPCPDGSTSSELKATGGGFGLQGMRERIELLGGRFVAEPGPLGWTVEVAVPT